MNMKLIFNNGEKLYFKQNPAQFVENVLNVNLEDWQKRVLNNNDNNTKIYGDDFIVEIIPKNINGQCVLKITDFDENQYKESEINIGFNGEELRQLISTLSHVYENYI